VISKVDDGLLISLVVTCDQHKRSSQLDKSDRLNGFCQFLSEWCCRSTFLESCRLLQAYTPHDLRTITSFTSHYEFDGFLT